MRHSKQTVSVELPLAFVDFMREVHQQIVDGEEAATTIESDDLLQCDCVYGGLYDIENRRYCFQYFHTDDHTWDFDLHAHEISAIAIGTTKRIDLWRCESDCGCFFAAEDAYCTHCDSFAHFDNYEVELRLHEPDADEETQRAMENLRRIGLAILDYHNEYDCFPPHATTDATGNKLHSWRSLILPFLDEDAIFDMIDFDQPWNSESNKSVWNQQPSAFSSAAFASPLTQILAVVASKTIWPNSRKCSWTEITSGTSFTIAAVRANRLSTNWMQPWDPDVEVLANDIKNTNELLAVFVDGHVETIRDVSLERLRDLLFV